MGEEIIRTSFNTQITSEKDDIIENPTFVHTNPQPPHRCSRNNPTEPEIPTEKPITPQVTVNKVTFTNSLNWSGTISCYYWSDSNSSMTSWSGVAMQKSGTNEYGQTLYTFTVPDGANKIIFTNGSSQTVDISYKGGEVRYYAMDTKNGNNYNVTIW